MHDHDRRMVNQQYKMNEDRRMRRNREDDRSRISSQTQGSDEPISDDLKGGKWIVVGVLFLAILLIALAEFMITFFISYFAG